MSSKSRKRKQNRARKYNEAVEKEPVGYSDIVRENESFERYYKGQGIVPDGEWEPFMSALRESLPTSFRITGSKCHAEALLKFIRSEYFNELVHIKDEAEPVEKPVCLPWYPGGMAWQLNLTRACIRRSEKFSKLHDFLVSETDSGNISRQEAVSMIPPLLLDVRPHHVVLDMCAAPGSKTAQLIEMLHANDDGTMPSGVVVANDVDNKRCYMLVHQAMRLQSPCFIITNHDSSAMPNIRIEEGGKVTNLKYDRILCDVPCSGDGTMRKNYDVWHKWNVANGNNLNGIQSRIAKRGLEMLKVGGKLVYSTCSFNPIEDEAVVHHLLEYSDGAVELMDVSDQLPGLRYQKGLKTWKLMSRDLEEFENPDSVSEMHRTQIRPQMFPPKPEIADKYHLDRCLRILPHLQNTGGFFVAVLQKVGPLPGEKIVQCNTGTGIVLKREQDNAEKPEREGNDAKSNWNVNDGDVEEKPRPSSPPAKKRRIQGYKEDPFFFFTEDEDVWPSIKDYYKIDSAFDQTCLLIRCRTARKRNIYLVSNPVKQMMLLNVDRLKIINTGVKVFMRCANKGATCDFRLTQVGLQTILPFMKSRLLHITKEDLILLLTVEYPFNNKLSSKTRDQFDANQSGCVALLYQTVEDGNMFQIALCGWRGMNSLRAYVPKGERLHYLRLCGYDTANHDINRDKVFRGKDEAVEEDADVSVKIKAEENDDTVVQPSDHSADRNGGDQSLKLIAPADPSMKPELASSKVGVPLVVVKDEITTN